MFRRIKKLLSRVLRPRDKREPEAPRDRYADRLAPVRRGPKGRSGAAAVAEPDEE
ncbi:MAG TPA: hypothetical protein VE825_11550 [Terriglobales bacterium]|jgi:hypothetical protein|nr:hypothetical protein [Terriglobales bacterium]